MKPLIEGGSNVIETVQKEKILFLFINKPKAMNALSIGVMNELYKQLIKGEKDESVKVIIITGKGDKAFVAGADINEFLTLKDEEEGKEYSLLGQKVFNAIDQLSKPVICAINGYALGGGLELALACDIRFASEEAKFALPEVKLGLFPGYGGAQRLPRLLGKGMAYYLMMSGEMITAREAERIGLVEKVVSRESLLAEVTDYASRISKFPSNALAALKSSVSNGVELPLGKALRIDAKEIGKLMVSHETRTRASAFLNRK